ncbi:hypothetical protein K1T71_000024 [Dendrolimus kikuchii]|uniref:Uncharacterized protein n=1 Tax=Dendrolimus kikuchii TaxID=765133 RepID=A0ACC1DJQ3_9NEOP|nr:hypothetical protein K1T71_000024 [Dendrolimus kikuchii]
MPKSPSRFQEEKVKLRKELGLPEGVTLILGIILGSGIFISPRAVYEKTGSVWGTLSVWATCGILATIGALSYAELGTALAQSGGDYHYLSESYGSLPAFLYLWDAVMVFVPSSSAIMGLTFANNVLQPIFGSTPIVPACRRLIAACTICLLTFINAYDVKFTTRLQSFFTAIMMTALVLIIGGGIIWIAQGRFEHFHDGWAGTKSSISEWSVAFFLGIFSYSGWNYLNFMVEELKDPFKNLPKAIYISLPVVTVLYLLANAAYLAVLGPEVLQTEAIAVDFARHALGWLRFVMPGLVAVATLGGLSVNIMTSARMCFAGARRGHMPELMAHINLKCMSPMPALLFLMLLSLIMLVPDNLTSLITYCSVVESFFTILTCSAVLWLRYKRPDLNRPIKVPLWMPAVFIVANMTLLIVPIISEPVAVISGITITFAGVPVYYALVMYRPKCIGNMSVKITHFCQKLFMAAVEDEE